MLMEIFSKKLKQIKICKYIFNNSLYIKLKNYFYIFTEIVN